MLYICRDSSVTLQTLLVMCIVWFQLPEGQTSSCSTVSCHSRRYRLSICRVRHGIDIFNVTLVRQVSSGTCYYYSGSPRQYKGYRGIFGYYSNILWTKNNCKAKFKVCYSVPAPCSTTASTASISGSNIVTISSTKTSFTTQFQESSSITNDVLTNNSYNTAEPEKGTSSNIVVAAVVPPLLIFVGLMVIGTVLVMKRQKRKQTSDKMKADVNDTIDKEKSNIGSTFKHTNEAEKQADIDVFSNANIYFVLEPQGQYAAYTSDVKHNDEAITTTTSSKASTRTESKHDLILEPQSHSLSDKTETGEDNLRKQIMLNAISESDFNNSVTDSYDLYASIDQGTVDIQTMPNHEYNVINKKQQIIVNESNYDVLSSLQSSGEMAEADEYSHIGNTRVICHDATYSHITLNQESEKK